MNAEERQRFENLENQLKGLKDSTSDKLADMRKFMYGLKDSIDDLVSLLKGDSFGNYSGLINEIKDQGTRIKKLEAVKTKLTWVITGALLPGGYGIWEVVKKIFPPLVILVIFTACGASKRKEDAAYRFFRENPLRLAELAQKHYPVVPRQGSITFDTLYRPVFRDSVLCPDSTKMVCPPCQGMIVKGLRVDTVPDMARIAALEGRLLEAEKKEAVLTAENERLKKQTKTRLYVSIGLGIGLLGALYLIFKP